MPKRALCLLLLLPAACAVPDPADPAGVLQEALASHQASIAGLGRPVAAGVEGTEAPPARAPARLTGDGPPSMAGQLVGQPTESVTRMLGEPRLRRAEGAAEVWHYQGPQCHLDLVLYREDGPRPVMRVAFAAARAVGTARRGEAACLRDISRGSAARPAEADGAQS